MRRKFYQTLLKWKHDSNGKTALLIDGARRVGKSWLVENVVAQMLLASGHLPYFYSKSDRVNAANRMEIDFLLDKPNLTRRHNVSPVEVKSGRNVTHASLDKFASKFKDCLGERFLLSDRDVKMDSGITHLPLYMAPLPVPLSLSQSCPNSGRDV